MNKISIADKDYLFILTTLKHYLPDAKFYLFGSRSKKTYKQYSDIDIAIDNITSINNNTLCKIVSEFENSILPYEVDIIDLNNITDNFKSAIKDELINLN